METCYSENRHFEKRIPPNVGNPEDGLPFRKIARGIYRRIAGLLNLKINHGAIWASNRGVSDKV